MQSVQLLSHNSETVRQIVDARPHGPLRSSFRSWSIWRTISRFGFAFHLAQFYHDSALVRRGVCRISCQFWAIEMAASWCGPLPAANFLGHAGWCCVQKAAQASHVREWLGNSWILHRCWCWYHWCHVSHVGSVHISHPASTTSLWGSANAQSTRRPDWCSSHNQCYQIDNCAMRTPRSSP